MLWLFGSILPVGKQRAARGSQHNSRAPWAAQRFVGSPRAWGCTLLLEDMPQALLSPPWGQQHVQHGLLINSKTPTLERFPWNKAFYPETAARRAFGGGQMSHLPWDLTLRHLGCSLGLGEEHPDLCHQQLQRNGHGFLITSK